MITCKIYDQSFVNIYKDEIEHEYYLLTRSNNFELSDIDHDERHQLIEQTAKATVMNKILIRSVKYLNE